MTRRYLLRTVFLILLLLCVSGWAVSYFRAIMVVHHEHSLVRVGAAQGVLFARWHIAMLSSIHYPKGWSVQCHPTTGPYSLHFFDGDFLGFTLLRLAPVGGGTPNGYAVVPFWFPTLLSTLALLFVWRKKTRKPTSIGAFPVEITTKKGTE